MVFSYNSIAFKPSKGLSKFNSDFICFPQQLLQLFFQIKVISLSFISDVDP